VTAPAASFASHSRLEQHLQPQLHYARAAAAKAGVGLGLVGGLDDGVEFPSFGHPTGTDEVGHAIVERPGEAVSGVEVRAPLLSSGVVGILREGDGRKVEGDSIGGIVQRLGSGVPGETGEPSGSYLCAENFEARRSADAEKVARETFDIERRLLGAEYLDTLDTMDFLAVNLARLVRQAEAEKLERETLDIMRRVLGPEHPYTTLSTYNLCILALGSKRDDALSLTPVG
jgi:Tetratricopeptide repeat